MLIYYIAVSILTFLIVGIDKFRARARQWRIPERTLLTLNWLGGAFGLLAGMLLFRHKTRKPIFWISAGVSSVLHAAILYIFTIS